MKTADVLKYFEHPDRNPAGKKASYAVAQKLGISRQAVEAWGELVPKTAAFELDFLTKGALKCNPMTYIRKRANRL